MRRTAWSPSPVCALIGADVSNTAPKALPRAYSYARFSTPEQAKGDSLRRQTEAARAWAQQHGIELDTELNLTDKGISAYAGANMETGALGVFLEAVKEGVVPKGSWLLVESLDRISRQTAWDASYTMQGIVRAGVTVVDLSDGAREYNTETLSADPMALLVMVMMFSRANNESATKGMRVAGASRTSDGSSQAMKLLRSPTPSACQRGYDGMMMARHTN
jgi:DNA invertase Pin-like site-specific DNA recombinase